MLSCIRDPDPCLVFEPKILYRSATEEVPVSDYQLPIGRADVLLEGKIIEFSVNFDLNKIMIDLCYRKWCYPNRLGYSNSRTKRSSWNCKKGTENIMWGYWLGIYFAVGYGHSMQGWYTQYKYKYYYYLISGLSYKYYNIFSMKIEYRLWPNNRC